MNAILQFVMSHGYSILFTAVFARQIGLPVPANLFVLAAGALAATGKLGIAPIIVLAMIGCVLADWAWYEAGRQRGEKVLHFIHRLAPDPRTADRKAKESFARFGPSIVLVSKFVPGLDLVAPPMAGISRTSRLCFLAFETAGAGLWSAANAGLGYIFSHDLNRAAAYVGRAGTMLGGLTVVFLSMYVLRKLVSEKRPQRSIRRLPETIRQKFFNARHKPRNPEQEGEAPVLRESKHAAG